MTGQWMQQVVAELTDGAEFPDYEGWEEVTT